MGILPKLEGEEGFRGWEIARKWVTLVQQKLLESLNKTGKPIILVLLNGGPLEHSMGTGKYSRYFRSMVSGEEGGNAIAESPFWQLLSCGPYADDNGLSIG